MSVPAFFNITFRRGHVNRKSLFWVGPLALVGLVSIGASSSEAATKKPVKTPAVKHTVYSVQRAETRKAKLAPPRAATMAREMADTVLPRYKVDASGDLVPDVRAAAAIIFN